MPTISELQSQLRARGLPTNGRKAQLEERLRQALGQDAANRSRAGTSTSASGADSKRHHGDHDGKRSGRAHDAAAFFASLAGAGEDVMDPEKTLAFCESLCIDPEAKVAIGLSYCLKAPSMGTFERHSFTEGAMELGISDLEGLKHLLPAIEKRTSWGGSEFDTVYKFAYVWGCEPGIRNLKKEVAISLWKLLVPTSGFPFLDDWVNYWEDSSARVVTRDEWSSFKRYMDLVKTSKKLIETDDAWPIAIDEFLERMKKTKPTV